MENKLIFVISLPRSGSTLLQRMLGSHTKIFTHPEPHLITPLAYLGFHDTVDKAPFDHINSAEAIRLFVDGLPGKEQDYLEAVRAYTDTMYGKMLKTRSDKTHFLDKTPAYGLVLPFLMKLYPNAKYIILTRHPLAIFSSFANSFFNGDWQAAHDFNPILERYIPVISKALRTQSAPMLHVAYEDLVREPEQHLKKMFEFIGLEHEPGAVNYGERFEEKGGPGDPINVKKLGKPVSDSLQKWAAELSQDEGKLKLAQTMISKIDTKDLATWGTPTETLFAALESASGLTVPKPVHNKYTFQRKVMMALKKNIHSRPHGKVIRKIKYYCDVLLRE